ncbi:MAG: YeeE/YedE family protein [Phycisphaerae bacterium]|nr:YeeE/YedE family protein [Phycisphaerae bacterium]
MVSKALLPWWVGGLLLGLIQILAVVANSPLGVSTQFVVVDSKIIHNVSEDYAKEHSLISQEKYTKFGYGFWLDIGLVCGAFLAAVLSGSFRLSLTTKWWKVNYGSNLGRRFATGFVGGILILLGSRFAHGCTSGAFASGWAQLSLSALPFTITLFGFGMLTAKLAYKQSPEIERE